MRSPAEVVDVSVASAETKAAGSFVKLAILGFLAGAFMGFVGQGSTMASFNLLADPDTYGLGRLVAGTVFPVGLILVVIAGGELFTGNTLMVTAALKRRITWARLLRNWGIVYLFNFFGALTIALLMMASGLFDSGDALFGAVTVKVAAGKTSLSFGAALASGILCNWLVCLGVWMAYATDSLAAKCLAIFFPVWLFVTSGFEHSIANMYYLCSGFLAKARYGDEAAAIGVSEEALAGLDVAGIVGNLVPVTLGNIIGGCLFVGIAYAVAQNKLRRG
jgi:formate/nitrite transporter